MGYYGDLCNSVNPYGNGETMPSFFASVAHSNAWISTVINSYDNSWVVPPSEAPTSSPTGSPTEDPTRSPTEATTPSPSDSPTIEGLTLSPTYPTYYPTFSPTLEPTEEVECCAGHLCCSSHSDCPCSHPMCTA